MSMDLIKKGIMGALVGVGMLVGAATGAAAQDYPNRPITLIVPFATGGGTDLTARLFAEAASRVLGQPMVIENRPGAGGMAGAAQLATMEPDGYSLLWAGPSIFTTAPILYKELPYDPVESFSLIGRSMGGQLALAVNNDVPAQTVGEFIEYAASRSGDLNYGSAGAGSVLHLALEVFNMETGGHLAHIPYAGNGPVYVALMSGEIQIALVSLEYLMTLEAGGPVRPLAITSFQRSELFPDLPTADESGLPGYEASNWYGVAGPANLPQNVVDRLVAAMGEVYKDEKFQELAIKGGYLPIVETPADFEKLIREETETWAKVAERAGITPQ